MADAAGRGLAAAGKAPAADPDRQAFQEGRAGRGLVAVGKAPAADPDRQAFQEDRADRDLAAAGEDFPAGDAVPAVNAAAARS